ncbi:(d)CMP kinase [Alkalicoccus urumqiensis]|uniref:Cytidylate kinase n=1 Tax=Alkalicoccus urumqiensis TaxID=1548213 RepID=A0A2P6MKK7_ALKUR|nr:(d)CMP kinase [Alkalicoccus urumqiensis]PRO66795.1 (d)CMP kinase [Alkalicoccus urumqiensis]
MEKTVAVAIDGPAGAGKSSTARQVALELGMTYIDTGAMYRALTWLALEKEVSTRDEEGLHRLLKNMALELVTGTGTDRVIVDGTDVTEAIREPRVTAEVSYTAVHEKIRQAMVEKQRELASQGSVVMDGRDIGTAVLPDAELKFYLTASVEERAARRFAEEKKKGIPSELEQLKKEIAERDRIDSEREFAPLTKAEDAEEVDTTAMEFEEVVQFLINRIGSRVSAGE